MRSWLPAAVALCSACECAQLPKLIFKCNHSACPTGLQCVEEYCVPAPDGGSDADGGADAGLPLFAFALVDARAQFVSMNDLELRPDGGFAVSGNLTGTVDFGKLGVHTGTGERPWFGWLDRAGRLEDLRVLEGKGEGSSASYSRGIAVDPLTGETFGCGEYDLDGLTFPDGTMAPTTTTGANYHGYCLAMLPFGAPNEWAEAIYPVAALGAFAKTLKPTFDPASGVLLLSGSYQGLLQIGDAGHGVAMGTRTMWWAEADTSGHVKSFDTLSCGAATDSAEPLSTTILGTDWFIAGRYGPCEAWAPDAGVSAVFVLRANSGQKDLPPRVYPGLRAEVDSLAGSRAAITTWGSELWLAAQLDGVMDLPDGGRLTAAPTGARNVVVARLDTVKLAVAEAFVLDGANVGPRALRVFGDELYLSGWFEGSGFGNDAGRFTSTFKDGFIARIPRGGPAVVTPIPGDGNEAIGGFVVDARHVATVDGTFTVNVTLGDAGFSADGGTSAFLGQVLLR